MWDKFKIHAQGSMFMRILPHGLLSFLMAIFLATTSIVTPVYAAPATWSGDNLVYDGKSFEPAGQAKDGDPRGFATGTTMYEFRDPATPDGQKFHYLIFAPGVDVKNTKEAQYLTFQHAPPNTYVTPSPKQAVTVGTANQTDQQKEGEFSSCANESIGETGWIVCPITNTLARAMDFIFQVLSGFLNVRPVSTDLESPLYRSWNMMRNIANVCFIIAFLIVVYSQVTTIGMSNYNAKKLMPRLIVAAILVNLSYWICGGAVDLSNALGHSIHQFFIELRESLVGPGGNGWEKLNWTEITAAVLGGTAGVAALGLTVAANTIPGTIFLIIPFLLGVLLSALVALIILAARQAVITIFIIISPLAFVAFILPSTNKWFDKWHEAFMTLLLVFPIFAVIFGGSQLAGAAIIQNADSLLTIIFGMAVQVAPLVVTPLLIKFSGGILGKVAGIVNNPKKGLLDRTRNWSSARRDISRNRAAASGLRRHAGARYFDRRRRSFELQQQESKDTAENAFYESSIGRRHAKAKHEISDRRKITDTRNEIAYKSSSIGRQLDFNNRDTAEDLKKVDSEHERRFERYRTTDAAAIRRDLTIRTIADQTNHAKIVADKTYEEQKAGTIPEALRGQATLQDMRNAHETRDTVQAIALAGMAKRNAEFKVQSNLSSAIEKNVVRAAFDGKTAREYAAGIQGQQGQASALANAVSMSREQFGKFSKEFDELRDQYNIKMQDVKDFAYNGKPLEFKDSSGNVVMSVDVSNEPAMNSMVKHIASKGVVEEVDQLLTLVGKGKPLYMYRDTVADVIGAHGPRSIYEGGQMIDLTHQGAVSSRNDLLEHVQAQLDKGKVSAAKLSELDGTAVQRFVEAVAHQRRTGQTNDAGFTVGGLANYQNNLGKFLKNAHDALTDPQLMGNVTENARPWLEELDNLYSQLPLDTKGNIVMTPAIERRIQQHFKSYIDPSSGLRPIRRTW